MNVESLTINVERGTKSRVQSSEFRVQLREDEERGTSKDDHLKF